jgi:hypothetical protein
MNILIYTEWIFFLVAEFNVDFTIAITTPTKPIKIATILISPAI